MYGVVRPGLKKKTPCHFWQRVLFMSDLVARILPLIALAAVDGFIAAGLKGHLGSGTAAIANDFVHLAIATTGTASLGIALVGSAGRAAARFVCEALLGEESLFRSRENEVDTTVTAGKSFVIVHRCTS